MTNQYKVSDKDFNLPLAPLWVFYRISCTERHKALFCERKANMKLHFKPKAHSWSLFGSPVTLFLGLSWRHHLQLGWGRNRSMSREIEGKHVLSSSWGRRTFRGSSWGNCCSQTVFFFRDNSMCVVWGAAIVDLRCRFSCGGLLCVRVPTHWCLPYQEAGRGKKQKGVHLRATLLSSFATFFLRLRLRLFFVIKPR